MMRKRKHVKEEAPEDEFEAPPVLEPEATNEEPSRSNTFNQVEFQTFEEGQYQTVPEGQFAAPNEIEFNFVDNENVQCGICGEIVAFKTLFNDHITNRHPEYSGYTLEDDGYIPYQAYQKPFIEPGRYDPRVSNKMSLPPHFNNDPTRPIRSTRALRKVSQIRVNINEMDLDKLEDCLNKKMVEKMGRKVPVTLVDKQHARCGLCNAVVSLNKKFEIVHLVRHFNAWHPSAHKCSGHWMQRIQETDPYELQMKPLGLEDFAVIDLNAGAADNLQCIWCGMFMDVDSLAMHFHEIHPEEVEVPKCRLCLQELVTNARFKEKFGELMDIRLPDEHHYKCRRFEVTTSSEAGLDRALKRHMKKSNNDQGTTPARESDDETVQDEEQAAGPEPFSNSRMSFGKRNKPKRQFIMPSLRQADPVNSKFVQPISDCHWKCKLCGMDILAAVISAGAIKHYRQYHSLQLDPMQSELCKARLEKISDGCMEFVNSEEIECLICGMTYPLHRPYNMCRAIRHLKLKHPEQMPEYNASFIDETNPELQAEDSMEEEGIENGLNDGPVPLQPQTLRPNERRQLAVERSRQDDPPQILEEN